MFKRPYTVAMGVTLALVSSVGGAVEPRKAEVRFSVEPQPLRMALNEWAEQAGMSVVLPAGEAAGSGLSPRVEGMLPVERALGLLLAGSGLAYRVVDEHTVAVQQESERFTKHISSKSTASSADSESGAQSSAPSGGTFSSLSQVATTSATDDSHRAPAKEELEEIVVTGTHIRGVKRVSAPSMTIAREEMERAGFTTVEEVFSALPQNFGGISFAATYALEGTSSLAQSNTDRAVGVDLRGLGAQSTLTLLNGHRRAGSLDGRVVDISAIPLSVIDRVEVVTGGRSAIYGSDAVAGVVNLVTRHDFQGAQTQASYGWTDSGGGEAQVSQIFGLHSDHGGFVAAYDYSRQSTLDLVDTGLFVSPIPSNGQTILRRDIQPRGTRHSGYLAGTIDIGDRVHISGDALYTSREFDQASIWLFNEVSNPSHDFGSNSSDQFSFALSSQIDLTSAWGLNISVTDSGVKNSFDSDAFYDLGFFSVSLPFNQDSDSGISTLSSVFEGPLPSIAGIVPRAAFGAERRWEDFKRTRTSAPTIDNDRTVNSAFVELLLPINQVEVSLAGRYDKYSDFGSTVNPQFGVSWAINRDLTIRGAYSEAFRAPALVELGTTADVTLSELSDPLSGGVTPVLFRTGDNSDLEPEEAKTWSFGMATKFGFNIQRRVQKEN
jgi:outer membrane cobalamin receptor